MWSDPRPTLRRVPRGPTVLAVAALGLAGVLPASGQLEQQDIEVESSPIPESVRQTYDQAMALFATVDQADSIPLLTQVIAELEPLVGIGGVEVTALLAESLSHRAAAEFNFGNNDQARADLVRLIELDSGFSLDAETASRKLVELFEETRRERVGEVQMLLEPADATVRLDGEPLPNAAGQHALLADTYVVRVERPGYAPVDTELEVVAGELTTFEQTLERTSAVLSLRTRPTAARVTVDGVLRGETAGQAPPDFVPSGAAARYPASDFSAALQIGDLSPGAHRIEVTRPGFRTFRSELEIDRLDDFTLPPVLLEREAGTLALGSLPSDAEVALDGRAMRPTRGDDGSSQLVVSPGSYVVTVTRSTGDFFETVVDIADGELETVAVELRPALILLGVLGGDDVGAKRLSQQIVDVIGMAGHWSPLDRSTPATPLLAELGLDVATLRRLAGRGEAGTSPSVDWGAVQSAIAEQLRGGVYLLGVLSDDLLATEADLWIWPTPPGPPLPELRTIPLDGSEALTRLAAGFAPILRRNRPVLGALTFDSAAGEGPVVAHLTTGGPAERAGLSVGDQITALAGAPIFSSSQLEEQLLELESGETVKVEVRGPGGNRSVDLVVGGSLDVLRFNNPDVVYPAAAARLAAELSQASDWPRWVLLVNQAALQLRSGDAESAVRTLRSIDAGAIPTGRAGLGQGAVDYLLGLALTAAGPRYADLAKEAFQRAAETGAGRLNHDDGPFVAPRALAHLGMLGTAAAGSP
ncbi:MAG TPA: PEGA domain-containing protein [Thermoanaerobaculia bacterium]|nr:PEGA domain-containing protein [Thermoanaerobaculia bacterium]